MMKIEVLISTMYTDNIIKLVDDMNISTDCIVVNQCNCESEKIEKIKHNNHNIKIIYSPERGLSKSRNKALENVSEDTDIVIFTDDDIYFSDDYNDKIKSAYSNVDADGIVFNVRRANGSLNKKMAKKVGYITLFRACSVSLTFKKKNIEGIRFDENFGAGSGKYILGEENIFVSDCLKKGLKIYSNNYIMCSIINKRESTWYTGINDEFLFSKGASFARIYDKFYWIFNLDFSLRKFRIYKKNISLFKALSKLFKGSFEYKKNKKV